MTVTIDIQSHLQRLALEPAEPAALAAVESAYQGQGRWEELLRVYEDNALRATRAVAPSLLRKAAGVCLKELVSSPRAESYLKRALDLEPTDLESLRLLRELYFQRGDYEKCLEVYERELARTPDPKERAKGLLATAEIYRERLNRLEKAVSALRQAERLDASNPDVFMVTAALAEAQGRLDQAKDALCKELALAGPKPDVLARLAGLAVRLLERPKLHDRAREAADKVLAVEPTNQQALKARAELDTYSTNWSARAAELAQVAIHFEPTDKETAARTWLTVAEVQLVYGKQEDAALASVDRALAARPGHPAALRLLEEIYGAADRYDELSLKLEMMAAYTREPQVAVELYLKAAMHHAVRLDNADAAARIYQRVLSLEPGNKVASNALAEYYRERQQWSEALSVLAIWAERATQAVDKVAAHYACCRILDEELNDRPRARPHYEAILGLDPQNQAAARALEAVYREAKDFPALARTLRAKLAGAQGTERTAILSELGDLYAGPLSDPGQALEVIGEIYEAAPAPALRERLEELASRSGGFAALVKILEGGLDKIASDADKVQPLHSLAALYEGPRDAPLEALRVHRRILALAPDDARARQAVDRLLESAAASTDKVAFYEEQARAATLDVEKVKILHKLAAELTTTLKDYVRAVDVYRQILKISPGDGQAIDGLLALYRRDNRWAEVAETLAHKVSRLPAGAMRVPLLLETAVILETRLSQPEPAVDRYIEILQLSDGNADAIAGLERLLTLTSRVALVAEQLEPRYAAQNRWDRVAQMLEIRATQCADPAARAKILATVADTYEKKLSRAAEAMQALLRAFQADPASTDIQAQLERLAQTLGDVKSLVRAYRSAGRVLDGAARVQIVSRAGSLAARDGDLAGALLDFLRLVGIDDATDKLALEAASRLCKAGPSAPKLRDTAAQVAQSLDESQQLRYWRTLARFSEKTMNSADDAIASWKNVLALQPTDEEALKELDRMLETSSDPQGLAQHLREKLAQATDEANKIAIGTRLADVLATRVNDIPGAISELAKVAELAPGQRAIWQQLGDLYAKAGMPKEAAAAMQREINLLGDGADRRTRLVAYADLCARQLNDAGGALGALQGVVAQEPAHPQALALLGDLYNATVDPALRQALASMLLPGLRAGGHWKEAVALSAARIDSLPEAERVPALRDLAAIKAEKLGDAEGAFADLEAAFQKMPLDAELRRELEQLAEKNNLLPRLVDAYAAALGVIPDADSQRPIRRKLAESLDRLGRGAEAVEHYKAAGGGALPEDLPSLEALERLLRTQNRPQELADVLSLIVAKLPEDAKDKKKAILADLGQLCEQVVNDKSGALSAYRKLVELDPKDLKALRSLERVLAELGDPQELAAVLDKLIELGAATPEVVDDYLKRAQVAVELEQLDEAFKCYRAVLLKKREHPAAVAGLEMLIERSPNKIEIAQVLEPLYTAKQDHAKLAWVLTRRLEAITELTQRKSLLRRIGDIYENRLQQKDQAFAMARRSLSEDPADMGVRMWIEKLAGETSALKELALAYVEEARKAEPKLALQFHRRAAAILHEKVNDTAGAVGEYEAILQIEPKDEKALGGLEAIFRATEAHAELAGVLTRRLSLTAGIERKREYLAEIAQIQGEKLGDLAAAFETYKQILQLTPDDPAPFEKAETLLAQQARWEDLCKLYDEEVKRLADKRSKDWVARRLELMYRRGRVLDEQFGDREQAATVLDAVLTENPEHPSTIAYLQARATQAIPEAIALLEKVYKARSAWPKYVELLQLKLSQTAESDKRREIYIEAARTYDDELKAGDMAFLALRTAFNENRADRDLLDRLEKLAAKYNAWQELCAALSVDLDALPDPKLRQHILHRLGDICGNQLNNPQQAILYLQHALKFEPTDQEALDTLDGLLEKNQMWAALADILERRIDMAGTPKEKSSLLERLAGVWGEKLMDAEAALRCHKQILEIDPDHPLTLKAMQKLYGEVQDWDALAKNLARQEEVLKEKDDQIRIHAAAGELYAEELGDNAAAISHWLKVVELEPPHPVANPALDVLLSAEERWEELAEHYRRQLTFTKDPALKSEINRRLGVILGEKLKRTDESLSSWLEVLQHDQRNPDALRALLPLYTERAMWEEFVGVARRLIPLADPAEAKEVRLQLARALGENLGKHDEAVKLAREVRATEPHTAEQLMRLATMLVNIEAYDEAVIALEKAGAIEATPEAKLAHYYQAVDLYRDKLVKPNDAREALEAILETQPNDAKAYELLADVYRNTQEWRQLVVLDETFVVQADTLEKRIAILTEIRDTQDQKLGEKEMAFIAGCRVYKENPQSLDAAAVLEKIGIETGGAEELVAVLEDQVESIVDTEIKIASYKRISRVHAEHLKDYDAAEAALEKVLAIVPNDLEALDSLAALGARTERYDKQVQALERKLQQVSEDVAKKAVLFEIARIWEDRINEVEEAIAALRRVLEIDGGDMTALNELVRIFEKENRAAELAHTLTRKVELTQDPAQSIELRMRVGGLCEGELNDPEAAIQWYRGVLDFDGAHAGALSSLERLYTGLERWSELVQVFEVQLSVAQATEDKIRLLAKMASIYENEFDSQKDAAACYERVLQVDSTHIPSIKNLERLLRALGEWNRLIEILHHHITLLQDQNEITTLYLEIGEIYYKDLARVDKAEQIYNAAKQLNPKSTAALHALGQLYERSGNWFQSLEMLVAEADSLGTDPAALPVLLRIGRINEEMLMDIDAAKGAYSRALGIDPTYAPALAAMKDIAKRHEDWESYSEHLITEAETADDPEVKTDLFLEAARFFQTVRSDEASALRYYQRALDTTPGHFEAAKALAEIHFRAEQWKEAGDLYMIVLNNLDKSKDAKEYCQKSHRLGYISEKLGSRDDALEFYKQAFEADATYLPALEGLGQALLTTQQWDEALKVFQTILVHHRDSLTESEVVDVQWQIGDICMKQSQPDRAYKQFEKALEIDPDHGPSLSALAKLDQLMENWEGAYGRLARLAEVAPGPERVDVLMEMSDIAAQRLNDNARCIDALEKARKLGQPRLDLLEKIAEAYLRVQQAPKAVEALEQAVALAEDRAKLSDLSFRLAILYETEIKHLPNAVARYNAALDAMPTNIKAFEAIERILSSVREWGLLEANYRAMIARAKDLSPTVRLVLWRALGELYRRVLKNLDGAIMAYEVIQKLDPGKREDQLVLAELYGQKPETRKKAIAMNHELLPTMDNPVAPIRTLRKLYHAERDFDAVYMLCSALAFLREADEEEKKIFEYLAQGVPPKAAQGLSQETWKLIMHPDLMRPIGTLAAWLYQSAPDFVTVPAKDLGLKKKDQVDVRQSELYFANLARYAGKVLNIQVFDAFKKAGSMEPLHLVNAQPPALVAGENNEIFRDAAQRVVLFHLGKNLAYARPEMFLAGIFPPEGLRDLLLGLCVVYNRSLPHNGDPREVDRWAASFEKLPPPTLKRLQQPAANAYADIVKGAPLEAYGKAVEITAARAGFLVAGELAAAVRGISEGVAGASTMAVRDRVKDLVLFTVSRPCFEVRKLVGAALVESKGGAAAAR